MRAGAIVSGEVSLRPGKHELYHYMSSAAANFEFVRIEVIGLRGRTEIEAEI
jgi:hypothetical protein